MKRKRSATDLDLAYELQLEEAMTDSLLQPRIGENETLPIDPETLDLLFKFETEHLDSEKSQQEMHKVQEDLKRRTHDRKFAQELLQMPDQEWLNYGDQLEKPFAKGASSSSSGDGDGDLFKLYFKGLFRDERLESLSIAGIGAAICDPQGNLILSIHKPLVGDWKSDWEVENLLLKVELKALMEGLNAALSLDIKRIEFCCDNYPLHQSITMKWLIQQQKIATVVDQVSLLQRRFTICRSSVVALGNVKFAFELARAAIDSQLTTPIAESSGSKNLKERCDICVEDIDGGQMFSVDGCLHQYCTSCMKQHVEAKLLDGVVPGCPHEGCNTPLNISSCGKFLSPELLDKMRHHIKEASIPAAEKLYCPNPACSVLMTKSEVLPYRDNILIGVDRSVMGQCINCRLLFCINCKVSWHRNLSCDEYKRSDHNSDAEDAKLKSLAATKSWRQCMKCKHLIELLEGCYHITCRCGHEFCYTCGAEWLNKRPTCRCPIWDANLLLHPEA